MSADTPRFDYVAANDLDGKLEMFPALQNPETEIDDSQALFEAARLVRANLHQIEGGLDGLIDAVGTIHTDPSNDTGLIIEDEMGGGSVTIERDETDVVATYVEDGEWTVGTDRFFEMLGALKEAE